MQKRTFIILLGVLLTFLLAACSEDTQVPNQTNSYSLLTVASDTAVLGTTVKATLPKTLEYVGTTQSDASLLRAVNQEGNTLTLALVGNEAVENNLTTLVFKGTGSLKALDVTVVDAETLELRKLEPTQLTKVAVEPELESEKETSLATQQAPTGVLIPSTAVLESAFAANKLGDYNKDGNVNLVDVIAILNVITGKTTPSNSYQYYISDFTNNNRIELLDAIAALQKSVGAPANLVTRTSSSLVPGKTSTVVLFNAGDNFTTAPVITPPNGVTVTGPNPSLPGQSFAYTLTVAANATGSVLVNAGGINQASLPITTAGSGGGTGNPLVDLVFYTTDKSTAVNPKPVEGQLTVRANFDLGSAQGDRIELLLNGVVVQTQKILGNLSQADLSVDTTTFKCDTLAPDYPNRAYDINVRLFLKDGKSITARNATNTTFKAVPFANKDKAILEILEGNKATAQGVTWYGGSDVKFRVCPIIYDIASGKRVEKVTVDPGRDGGSDSLNIGTGSGAARTITRATGPNFFTFTAAKGANSSYEDMRSPTRVFTKFSVKAIDQNNFEIATIDSGAYYLDFKGPQTDGKIRYKRFNFGTSTKKAPHFEDAAVPMVSANLSVSKKYIGPKTPIVAPTKIYDQGVGLASNYQPKVDILDGNASAVKASVALGNATTGQTLADSLNIFTSTNVVTLITGFRAQLSKDTVDILGNKMSGTELSESRTGLFGFDFDPPKVENVGPKANGIYSNSFLSVLAINETGNPAAPKFPIQEPDTFKKYDDNDDKKEDYVFNSIFRANVTDAKAGLKDADASNNVKAYDKVQTGTTISDFVVKNPPDDDTGFTTEFNNGKLELVVKDKAKLKEIVGNMLDTDPQKDFDAPFDKTIAVKQNSSLLNLVNAKADNLKGNLTENGYALDMSGGTKGPPNTTVNFVQSGSAIGDAQVDLNVVFYDSVGNAAKAQTLQHTIDRTEPDVSFQGFVNNANLGGSPSVVSSGTVRITDPNLDLDKSYVIVETDIIGPAPQKVQINGQDLSLTTPETKEKSLGDKVEATGKLSFTQAGLTNSSAFQPLEIRFFTGKVAPTNKYRIIIRSSDKARQLADNGEKDIKFSLPQIVVKDDKTVSGVKANDSLGLGNTANDFIDITVLP